jgi:hypothetical protein
MDSLNSAVEEGRKDRHDPNSWAVDALSYDGFLLHQYLPRVTSVFHLIKHKTVILT